MNKWCVTGTPVGKSLNDLYGLLLFLELDPYRVEAWWRLAVYTPYCLGDRGPMLEVISFTCHDYHYLSSLSLSSGAPGSTLEDEQEGCPGPD